MIHMQTLVQMFQTCPLFGMRLDSFPEPDVDAFALKTFPVWYSSLATPLTVPDPPQKRCGSTPENILMALLLETLIIRVHCEAPLHLHVPSVNGRGAFSRSLELQTDAGKFTSLTRTLGATPALAFQLTDSLTLSASDENSAIQSLLPAESPSPLTKLPRTTLLHSFITEDDILDICQILQLMR